MSLTLDDIINVKFPTDRREGYRYSAVDDFLDRLEPAFAELTQENERLRAEVGSAGESDPEAGAGLEEANSRVAELESQLAESHGENERLRGELESAHNAEGGSADEAELERLRTENAHLRGELDAANQAREQAEQARFAAEDGSGVERLVVTSAAEASPAVTRLVQLATEQAEAVVAEAQGEARRKLEEANRQAHEITIDAQTRAERVQSEARVNAEQVTNEAQAEAERLRGEASAAADQLTAEAEGNAARVNQDADARRAELMAALESERDSLLGKVDSLRGFENSYRQQLKNHFSAQLSALDNDQFEPVDAPELLINRQNNSATPRLDALLAEGDR